MSLKAREFGRLAEALSVLARKRQAHGLKRGKESSVPSNVTEREKGESSRKAAEEVGMSVNTAKKAAAVVKEIDKAETPTRSQFRAALDPFQPYLR